MVTRCGERGHRCSGRPNGAELPVVAAIPLAYAVIVSGFLIRNERLRLRNDLSYGTYVYAWPIQQLLVICGLGFMNPIVFATIAAIATFPLAALSWFLVEKRAMSLKSRLKRKWSAPALPEAGGDRDATAVDLVAGRPTPKVRGTA